jgi:hypothetical protein
MTVHAHAVRLVRAVIDWPVASQRTARRNALVAATTLAETRRERGQADAAVAAAVDRHAVRAGRSAHPA